MELLAALACVDYVVPFSTRTPVPLIEMNSARALCQGRGLHRGRPAGSRRGTRLRRRRADFIAGRGSLFDKFDCPRVRGVRRFGVLKDNYFMPLSVLQVASAFPNWGGAELHCLNLSQQLQQRGHAVTVACRPGHFVEGRAQEMGLATIPITVRRQLDWHDFSALRTFLRERKIDVLHAHWSTDMIVPPYAGLRENVPVRILTRHMPYPFKSRLGAWLYSQVLFTRIVTVSESVRKTMLASGVPADKAEVIHHGTNVEEFVQVTEDPRLVRQSLGLPGDVLAIGIAGRIAPEKGHRVLLEAMARLR